MLIKKIQEYIKEKGIESLSRESWVAKSQIVRLTSQDRRNFKFHKNTLDSFYYFFKIPRDDFFRDNLKRWYPKTYSLLGMLIRAKRIRLNMDIKEFCKKARIDTRAFARIEAWDSLPYFDSFTIKSICEILEFTEYEREIIETCVEWIKDIEKLVKKYDI